MQGVAVGDRVMALTLQTYAELVAVKATDVNHVPEGVSITDAAALPLVICTGEQLIREACELQPNQSVLVTGALASNFPDIDLALTDGWTSGSGMGVGLSGSRRLVNEFDLRTAAGEGTCVTVTRWK